jgi:hypothetical protein
MKPKKVKRDRLWGKELPDGRVFSHYAVLIYEEETTWPDGSSPAGWGVFSEELYEDDAAEAYFSVSQLHGNLGMIVEIYL